MKIGIEFMEDSDLSQINIYEPVEKYSLILSNEENSPDYIHNFIYKEGEIPGLRQERDLHEHFYPTESQQDVVYFDGKENEMVIFLTKEVEKELNEREKYRNGKLITLDGMKLIFGPKSELNDRNIVFPLSNYSFVPRREGKMRHIFTYKDFFPHREDELELFEDAEVEELDDTDVLIKYPDTDEEVMLVDKNIPESFDKKYPGIVQRGMVKLNRSE